MKRRELLASVGSACSVLVSGCLDRGWDAAGNSSSGVSDDESGTDGTDSDPEETDGDIDDRPYTLYVENLTEKERCIRVVVSTAEQTVIDGEYTVPGEEGLRFYNVLEGDSSIISAETSDQRVDRHTWNRRDCPTDTNNQDATIIIEDDAILGYQNQCDTVDAGSLLREYSGAESHRGCPDETATG